MENTTIAINMVIGLMNAKRNQDLKATIINVRKWTQGIRMQNQDIKSYRANCESNIWLGLQYLV